MADINLEKPEAGASLNMPSDPQGVYALNFPQEEVETLNQDGDNLQIILKDGSTINIENYYTAHNAENPPAFMVEGMPVAEQTFFENFDKGDITTAAGGSEAGAAERGGRYNEYGNSELGGGLEHLERLDYSSDRAFEFETGNWITSSDEEGYLTEIPEVSLNIVPTTPTNTVPTVTVVPAGPREPDSDPSRPDKPGSPDDPNSSSFIRAGDSTIVVDEGSLANGSHQHTYHGMSGKGIVLLDVHGEGQGRANILLADQHGNRVTFEQMGDIPVSGMKVTPTTAGTLVVNGVEVNILSALYNAETGKWTLDYEYSLTGAQTHGAPDSTTNTIVAFGPDNAISVQVTDFSGDVASGSITVEIHDDTPVFTEASYNYNSSWTYACIEGSGMKARFDSQASSQKIALIMLVSILMVAMAFCLLTLATQIR